MLILKAFSPEVSQDVSHCNAPTPTSQRNPQASRSLRELCLLGPGVRVLWGLHLWEVKIVEVSWLYGTDRSHCAVLRMGMGITRMSRDRGDGQKVQAARVACWDLLSRTRDPGRGKRRYRDCRWGRSDRGVDLLGSCQKWPPSLSVGRGPLAETGWQDIQLESTMFFAPGCVQASSRVAVSGTLWSIYGWKSLRLERLRNWP